MRLIASVGKRDECEYGGFCPRSELANHFELSLLRAKRTRCGRHRSGEIDTEIPEFCEP